MSQVALEPLPAAAHSLPKAPTPLIGRQQEIGAVRSLLQRTQARLITFTGPPGVGKSRLCLQIAHDLAEDFPDGVYFVPLAPLRDAPQVATTIAQTLGLQAAQPEQTLERLQIALGRRRLLLVLDNFEQVLAAAPLLAELLRSVHALTIFVTSRVALRLSGEYEYPVPPLALPTPEQTQITAVVQSPAVALFVARAQAVQANFQLTAANAAVVAEICRRLDGIPLAIELAAARSKLLPPPALLARLSNRLATLTHGARDLPARQQTLRAAIEWSYDLLAPAEKLLFRRLGIFRAGWTVAAIEAICADLPAQVPEGIPLDALNGLATLLDHSLIYAVSTSIDEPRYAMLELLSEFAQEELARSGEEAALCLRHAHYYCALVQQRIPVELEITAQIWYDQLEQEHNNIQAALHWLLNNAQLSLVMQTLVVLGRFWWERGHLNTSVTWTRRVLDQDLHSFASNTLAYTRAPFPLPPTPERAGLLYQIAFNEWVLGHWAEAAVLAEQSLLLYRQLDNQRGISWLTRLLGMVFAEQGAWGQAERVLQESLALCEALGDRGGGGFALLILGRVSFHLGDAQRAAAFFDQSETLFRQIGQVEGLFFYLREVGELTVMQSQPAQALPKLTESLALARQIDHKAGVVGGLLSLALAWVQLGEDRLALQHTQEAIALLRQMGVQGGLSGCYALLAQLAVKHRLPGEALAFWQMGETFRFHHCFAYRHGSLVDQLQATLAQHFHPPGDQSSQPGAIPTVEQALATLAETLQAQPNPPVPPVVPPLHQPPALALAAAFAELTSREYEVLQLLARGLTYSAIAETLVVSPRTVDAHLRAIYGKLGVNSRHAATRLWQEHQPQPT